MEQQKMKLEPGMLIKTNYSGPYRIQKVNRGCRCPFYDIDGTPQEQPEHIHLTLTHPDGSGRFWLGHFDEDTLLSLEKSYCGHKPELAYDWITILEQDTPVQYSMF